ncbi:Transcription factor GTE6 [Linum grandiflorum]
MVAGDRWDLTSCINCGMVFSQLESIVNEVEKFYLNLRKKQQLKACKREAATAKRMHELIRQFEIVLRQLTQHKWAWFFLQPVEVEGHGLHDYYEEAAHAKRAKNLSNELYALDMHLENLREVVVKNYRKWSTRA